MTLSDVGPLADLPEERAVLMHEVWAEIYPLGGFGGFISEEFAKPEAMEVGFLRLLFKARMLAGVPFRILSSYAERDGSRSTHSEYPCSAVDLQCLNSFERMRIVRAAIIVGFVRIGIYEGTYGMYRGMQKKDGGGIHLDASRSKPPRIWTRRTL